MHFENRLAYLEAYTLSAQADWDITNRATNLSIFEYEHIARAFQAPYHQHFAISENNFYGIGRVLSRFYDIGKHTLIEHGIYFGEYVPVTTFDDQVREIVTFSEYRKNVLKKQTDKPVHIVGSYINYADNLLNEFKFGQLKSKLGKVLLVFPSHSIATVHARFDAGHFIRFIHHIKNLGAFDTVLVCLYFKDIELGHDKIYQENGFKIVTAGFLFDYCFLNRLKTLILLSDYTISNDLGTHIGYCVQLGKPHQVFQSDIEFVAGEDKAGAYIEMNARNKTQKQLRTKEKQDICKLFSEFNEEITLEQQACVDYYWGKVPVAVSNIR